MRPASVRSMVRRAWGSVTVLVDHPRRRIAFLAVTSAVAGLIEAVVLVLVVRVAVSLASADRAGLDLPLSSGSVSPGAALAVAAGGAVAVAALHVLAAGRSAALAADALVASRERAVRTFAHAPWVVQHETRDGSLHESVGTLALNSAQMVNAFAMVVTSAVALVALLTVAVVSDPVAMATVVLLGVALTVCLRPIGAVARRRSRRFVEENTGYVEDVASYAALADDLRAFGSHRHAAATLHERHRRVAEAYRRMRFAQRLGWTLYRDVAVLLLVGAVAAVHLAGQGRLDGAGVAIALVVRSLASAQALQRNTLQLHELVPNVEMLDRRLDALGAVTSDGGAAVAPIDATVNRTSLSPSRAPGTGAPRLRADDVGYRHRAGRPTLHGIHLEVDPGELVAVVGPSGAGKTTLLQILAGLRRPSTGTVTVDGIDIADVDTEQWHRTVAVVSQETKLMPGTVADNIRFLRPYVDRVRIEDAAASARIADEITALPRGFETVLGPRGIGLSGGQRQRLALARALAGNPRILLLDEPTSALDARSEELVVETLRSVRGSITVVVVAHRESTAAACDRVVSIVAGRLVPSSERTRA